jgi:UDP-N-acetylglucosamine 2-epimerase (non-hydrolysing)
LSDLTAKVLLGITKVMEQEDPDMVIVQGDTTTTFVTSLSAYYLKIPVAHIEAGLRTNKKYSPFPEETNRHVTSVLADYHFAPTEEAVNNLLKEGIKNETIFLTGNTVIDALLWVIKKQAGNSSHDKWKKFFSKRYKLSFSTSKRLILVTGHRRENFGEGFENICLALSILAKNNSDIQIIYPVHLNPNVQKPVYSILEGIENIRLIPPLDYEPFVFLMNESYLILTDSGGIQEEAPSLGKPVLVMRDTTERPEGIKAGTSKLIGTNVERIVKETSILLNDERVYKRMAKATNPYGDGKSSKKIVDIISKLLTKE